MNTNINTNTSKTARNGRSLGTSLMTVSAKDMHRICSNKGITFEEAQNAVKVRQWLPYEEDPKEPAIDAEVLWRRIGKPHKQFRKWAEYHIKPMLERPNQAAEISPSFQTVRGGTKQGYLLSRDVAAKLAMQANTEEGNAVREYFLLMERIASSMAVYAFARAEKLIRCDVDLTRMLHGMAPNGLDKRDHKWWVSDKEILFKSKIAEVVSGARAGDWRDTLGSNKGIRDVLSIPDLDIYGDAYFTALAYLDAFGSIDRTMQALQKRYGNKINAEAYLLDDAGCVITRT